MPEQFEFQLWIVQAVLSELTLISIDFFGWDGSFLLPVFQVRQQSVDQGAIGLVFNRCFQTPFVVAASDLDLLIAVLNHNSIDLGSIEINHVLRLTTGFFRAWPLHFKKSEISDASERNAC